MSDSPDAELLEQFARNQSEAAFAELVERYLGLVYSTAFRKTGNPQQAEDITQAVFIILARKAGSLGPKTVLPGWLHHTARLTTANLQRAELRRIHREQEAFMQSTINESATDTLWRELSPWLDDAVASLGAGDRDAIVLRYFQNRSLAEVGATLGANEGAARMRVNRALEKLRKFFNKRGVISTTAVIAVAISNNSVQAAPAGLGATISAGALAKGAVAGASTLALVKTTLFTMTMKTKTVMATAILGTCILGAGLSGAYAFLHYKLPPYTFASKSSLTFANSVFRQDGDKDGFFTVDLDTSTLRTSTSAPAIHIKGPIDPAQNGNRRFLQSDNSSSTYCVVAPGSPLMGKHICVTGWLKTTNVQKWASAFLLVLTKEYGSKGWSRVDDMSERPIVGTTDWQQVKFVTDVPDQPCAIYFGPDLYGPGELWGDDFQISLADPDDPITDNRGWRQSCDRPHDYSMKTDPVNAHDGNSSICLAYTGSDIASRKAWTWFGQQIRYPENEGYAGHTMRLSGWIKTENVSNYVRPQIRPWDGSLRGGDSKLLAKDSMVQDISIKGTLNWTPFSVTCDIPENTGHIITGFVFSGSGKVWIDTNSLEMTILK
jgi:RNA polymerase sigma factor (sigma-70 family)